MNEYWFALWEECWLYMDQYRSCLWNHIGVVFRRLFGWFIKGCFVCLWTNIGSVYGAILELFMDQYWVRLWTNIWVVYMQQ